MSYMFNGEFDTICRSPFGANVVHQTRAELLEEDATVLVVITLRDQCLLMTINM